MSEGLRRNTNFMATYPRLCAALKGAQTLLQTDSSPQPALLSLFSHREKHGFWLPFFILTVTFYFDRHFHAQKFMLGPQTKLTQR